MYSIQYGDFDRWHCVCKENSSTTGLIHNFPFNVQQSGFVLIKSVYLKLFLCKNRNKGGCKHF